MNRAAGHGRHVFLVRSSLQYMLATALAADARARTQQDCRMLFLPDLLDPGLFLRAGRQWPDSPFDQVLHIESRRRTSGEAAPRPTSAAVRRELDAAIAQAEPVSLTVFNDREEAGQAALIAVARRFPRAQRHCAEDGAQAYTRFSYRAHGLATRWRQRLRLGRCWSDVRVLGTHPLVQRFIALRPSLLREELRSRHVLQFPAAALESPALHGLAEALCAGTGFDPGSVPGGATVLTVSHSSYARRNPGYASMVEACARRLGQASRPYFVKYHPRESQADYLGLRTRGAAGEVPRTLPVECMYLMLRDRELTVVGGMSTSLLTAGLLMPRVRCAALVGDGGSGDSWDHRLLEELHLVPLTSLADIDTCLGA
jgi:hypothetical protein